MRTAIMEMYGAKKVKREAWVPEGIADEDVADFMGAAAAAKKAGKDSFKFGDKSYKVTMKKDVAKAIDEESCPECGADGECQCEQPVKEAAGVYNKSGKVVAKFKDEEDANNYAMKNHDDLMEAKAPGATAQHGPDDTTSDSFKKQVGRTPLEKEFVDMHKTEVGLDVEKVTAQNKQSIEDALKQTPGRLGDQRAGDTSFVNPIKADIIDGITKALQQMKTNN
jgi:hypothetical protein